MCGITGFWDKRNRCDPEMTLSAMGEAIRLRGPDDSGSWHDTNEGVGLGHRRLSIVDLSPAGHQPMASADNRFVMVYNGEIYNAESIRADLVKAGKAPAWRGHSDTEVLLAAIGAWGFRSALERSVGMFSIAVWDRAEKCLMIARDRLGEKPLYYAQHDGAFLLASDIAALRQHPACPTSIDQGAIALLLRHNCIPAPYSIFSGIRKLMPGHYLVLKSPDDLSEPQAYWSVAQTYAPEATFTGTKEEAVDRIEALLREAIGGQMQADVPVGAFLSGGVDSSTTVALMQSLSPRPVHSFSIGFEEADYDESGYARTVAAHLGTAHTELRVSATDALKVIDRLPEIYSEPFSDSSQIPTFLVSQLARSKVTVSLSGDAGDEIFSGYNRYALADGLWKKLALLPTSVRGGLAAALTSIAPHRWDATANLLQCLLPSSKRHTRVGDKLHKLANLLTAADTDELYRRLTSHTDNPASLLVEGAEPPTLLTGLQKFGAYKDPVRQMMVHDLRTYLPDDILAKVDRATMAVSLESRVPFLDHRLIEFVATLPTSILRHGGVSKWPLRQILYRYVPQDLIERPKAGFGMPVDHWLRGPLKGWGEDLLAESSLQAQGYFNAKAVRLLWNEHQSGAKNRQHILWNILMFQQWHSRQKR